jgi:hypothetical protein
MISKYDALQEAIDNQPALGQQRLKAMLRFLQDGQVSDSELTKILTYDFQGKSEEQTELYNALVGLVIDLYIKNNGQDSFVALYNELKADKLEEQVEQPKEEEIKEGNSIIVAPQHTDRTPKAVAPRKKMRLASPKPKEEVQEPIEEPVEATEPIVSEEVAEIEPVEEQPETTVPEPVEPETYVEPTEEPEPEIEEATEEPEDTEVDLPEEADNEVEADTDEPDAEVEPDEGKKVKKRKKNGVLKYIAVGIPTVLAIGGLAFWQINTNSKNTSLAEQEVAKIMEEAPKKEEAGAGLSSGEFDTNVKSLTTAFDTIKQNDKTGLTGYFTFENKRYFIQKYDQSTGSLTVFDAKGEKVVYDDEWVQKFIENSKAKAKKTENKKDEKPKSSDDSSKKDEKQKSDSKEVQTKSSNSTKKKEGSN